MLAADYPFLDVFWTMILFFFWVAWIWILVSIIGDLFRRHDTSGWTKRFDLLSDTNRLEILLVLHRAPGICVGDLAAALGRSENAVSQALRVLRQQGWVSSTRVGRLVNYRLEYEHRWGNKTFYTQLRLDPLPPNRAG